MSEKREYCNLEPPKCKKLGRVKQDEDGYVCCNCGKRVSKWIPFCLVLGDKECQK